MSNNDYFIATGDADHLRLKILNKVYNPTAYQFLINSGLQSGMTVLEYGCGAGHMACLLAKHIGNTGRIVAIDNSQSQLDLAQENAEKLGITNIIFKLCDVHDLAKLEMQFDLVYGRWVLEFSKDPTRLLALLYDTLAPGGIFTYETSSLLENAHFSYPHQPLIDRWYEIGMANFNSLALDINFAHKLFYLLKKLRYQNLKIQTHQPILITPEEKSVHRLGLISSSPLSLKNNLITPDELEQMKKDFIEIENSETIIGFFRNILISGKK